MRRAAAALALTLASLIPGPASAQEAEPPAEPAGSATEEGSASNVVPLLIGGVLLGSGIWAYMNKKQRFPGTRFRE